MALPVSKDYALALPRFAMLLLKFEITPPHCLWTQDQANLSDTARRSSTNTSNTGFAGGHSQPIGKLTTHIGI